MGHLNFHFIPSNRIISGEQQYLVYVEGISCIGNLNSMAPSKCMSSALLSGRNSRLPPRLTTMPPKRQRITGLRRRHFPSSFL